MGKLTTHEERVAELRARLSGQVPNRTSRRNNRVAFTRPNPMLTAALHAASREVDGVELSPVEVRLVQMLTIFATDQEVAEYGKIYTETKGQAGKGTLSGTIFSGVALNMNADTPYTDDDMIADARAMTGDLLAMPENKILRVYGSAQWSRKQNDSAFGPKNEIYWAVASGSDRQSQKYFKTPEYGSVESGSQRTLGQEYFKGGVEEFLAGHIECWEADDSGSGFYRKLVETLGKISEWCIDAAVKANATDDWGDEYGSTGKAAAIMALVGICAGLVSALLDWLTNDDDLVFRREIAFTNSALIAWKGANKEMSFIFDGGSQGKHELWMTCYQPIFSLLP
ncbi:hypothetical protein BTUL_0229g00080 [Botrytis tulipae]|uniref:Uncharacterized protein n=1 Tax=Botrytis tulipae TaxID=87230 RepID=A0A4Z1EF61_9HELO|nr:hypothetical protein BTUL_0229g00080 [Botrytis tulipae]